ncbi:MAG: thioesterase family protein [Myxococcota bacterium]
MSPERPPADLLASIASTVVPARPHIYRAALDRSWSFVLPSGGVLMSVALGAMRQALGADAAHLVPIAANATFCSAVAEGPLEIDVVTLRAGKTAHQLRAHVRPMAGGPSDIGLEVTATWADPRSSPIGPEVRTFAEYPSDLPSPADSAHYHAPSPPPFYRNLEVRKAVGDVWWKPDWQLGEARTGRWFRYLVPPAAGSSGIIDALALPPIADTMASAVHQALGPQERGLILPSLDLTLHFVSPMASPADGWFLVHSRGHAVFSGQASARTEVWDEAGRLVALGTQTMTVRVRRSSP